MSRRDPQTGELTHPISINLHLSGQPLPEVYNAGSWKAAGNFFQSDEFRELANRVEFVTITDSGRTP